jgi:hypothetical protein
VTHCPRCGEDVAAGQEYCLECGLRLVGVSRLEPPPADGRRVVIALVVAAVVAAGGAALAITLTRDSTTAALIATATGGSQVAAAPVVATTHLEQWPARTSAWTNILVSVPKVDGRDAAVARAEQARRRGLRRVGVLDSSRFASLHPGYWMVFAGVYSSQPEAASRLREARAVQRGARTQRVSG